MAQEQIGVREVHIVFGTDRGNFTRTDIHWMDRVTNALAQVNNATFALEIVDEHGHVLRRVEFGEPTGAMKKVIDVEFGTDEVVA